MIKIKLLFLSLVFVISLSGIAQNRAPAFEMNDRLGRGINMGNTFEAPSETEWGNPWQPSYFKMIAELGFDHVRLPVRWEPSERSMASFPYTIKPEFLERIKLVVDSALRNKLHIVLNMHHHELLFENPTAQKERFLAQWSQIAEYFKDYPDTLLFEVLNEPHGNITPSLWNEYFADALVEIRKTNPTRVVLMGVAEFGGLGGIYQLEFPNDEYIILSPHYYNPFPFTHQGAEWLTGADQWLGTKWLDTEIDRETVVTEFNYAIQFSQKHHIPIHVGEFGAYNKADKESRDLWTTFLARWFEEQNMSWAYWEFSAGFGIYNPATKTYNASLVDALLHNEKPEPKKVYKTEIYTSDFSNGVNGWAVSSQNGANATILASSGKLNVSISNGGTEPWHLQLIRNNLRLEKDKTYRIAFTANAETDRSISFNTAKATSPWTSYSNSSAVILSTVPATYSFSFTMSQATDPAARLVFDLGKNASGVSISNVVVEELSFNPPPITTGVKEDAVKPNLLVYPNPVSSTLWVNNLAIYHTANVYDMKGKVLTTYRITPGSTSLQMEELTSGIYFLSLKGNQRNDKIKIIKQ